MNMAESSCVLPEPVNWGKKETATLIALYELEPCLYDRKDPNYNNTIERNDAYHRIKQVMIYILPNCTVQQIKNKIRSLCIQFITEKLSKECSIHNGLSTEDTYKPALWCFELLQFLDDHLKILPKKEKSKVIEDKKKESDDKNQCDSDDSASNHQCNEDEISYEVDDKSDNLNRMSDEDDRGETSSEVEENIENHSGMNRISFLNDDRGETSSEAEENIENHSGMNRDDQDDASSDMDENNFNGRNDKVNKKRKRKFDCLVSSSKKVSSEMVLDKEGIFGLYVADEMQNLRKNSLLYLKTKQSILKILTNANFKLANVEL